MQLSQSFADEDDPEVVRYLLSTIIADCKDDVLSPRSVQAPDDSVVREKEALEQKNKELMAEVERFKVCIVISEVAGSVF